MGSAQALSALQRLLQGPHGAVTEPGDTANTRHSDPNSCLPPSPEPRAEPVLWVKPGSPLVLLKAPPSRAARPKSAPAAGACFQEPNFHTLQVKVAREKLPAVTGNPGNSPNTSRPLGPVPR